MKSTTAATLSPREQTFAEIIGMIDDAVTGDNITSMELAGMILETVEKSMGDARGEAGRSSLHDAVCRELDCYAIHREELEVSACGDSILHDVEEAFRKAWAGA